MARDIAPTRLFFRRVDLTDATYVVVKVDQLGFVDLDFGSQSHMSVRINLRPEQADAVMIALGAAAKIARGV